MRTKRPDGHGQNAGQGRYLKTNKQFNTRSLITAVQNGQPFREGHVLREIPHGPFIGQHIL